MKWISILTIAATGLRAQTPQRGTIIVSNMNENTASIIDAATGRPIATLPTGLGPHEVTVSHDGKWALVSNYGSLTGGGPAGNSITVIDVAAAIVARTITLEGQQRPHGMAFLPGDSILAVTAERRGAILLVDFRSGAIVRTLFSGGRTPHMVSATSAGDHLATGNIGSGTVAYFTLAGSDSAKTIQVGRQPEGISIAPDGNTIWAGSNSDSVVVVVDARRGVPIDTLRGFGRPYRTLITPDSKTAVISDPKRGEIRILRVIDRKPLFTIPVAADSLTPGGDFPNSANPEGIAFSGDSKWAFVTLQGRSRLAIVDLTAGKIVRIDVTGLASDGVAWSPVR